MKTAKWIALVGLIFTFLIPVGVEYLPLMVNFDSSDLEGKMSIFKDFIEYFLGIILLAITGLSAYLAYFIEELKNVNKEVESKYLILIQKFGNVQKKLDSADEFVKNLIRDRGRVNEIEAHLFGRKDLTKEIGFKIWNDYLEKFEITESGIYLGGEDLALHSAVRIWRLLSIRQLQNPNHPIIARITHSNDISVWLPNEQPISNELYIYQKDFIKNGGIIVRFLIGKGKDPDERYKKAIDHMEKIGIDVRYFSVADVGEKDFDFLYLHDESFVLKWYSGMNGSRLAGCFVSDKAEEGIINRWATLFYKAKNDGKPINSIPKGREFFE